MKTPNKSTHLIGLSANISHVIGTRVKCETTVQQEGTRGNILLREAGGNFLLPDAYDFHWSSQGFRMIHWPFGYQFYPWVCFALSGSSEGSRWYLCIRHDKKPEGTFSYDKKPEGVQCMFSKVYSPNPELCRPYTLSQPSLTTRSRPEPSPTRATPRTPSRTVASHF